MNANLAEEPVVSTDLHGVFTALQKHLNSAIVGQPRFVERLLLALLADGHLLLEGAPGLAKTKAVKVLSSCIEGDEARIQFTPDLLPSDLTGTDIYRPERGEFEFQKGPLFHNLLLADEINRAPAKVQSALLEAMAERHVTVGGHTYALPELFMVMATQNPIEQEGTYPLPEAQLDRFMLHVKIGYPDQESEREILNILRGEAQGHHQHPVSILTQAQVFTARHEASEVYMARPIEDYLLQLVFATRNPAIYGEDLAGLVTVGASPRGTIALDRVCRAYAWLQGAQHVTPRDVQEVIKDVLRHRVLMSFEAEADGYNSDWLLDELIKRVPVS